MICSLGCTHEIPLNVMNQDIHVLSEKAIHIKTIHDERLRDPDSNVLVKINYTIQMQQLV